MVELSWPLISASAIPYSVRNQVPREMTADDMAAVRDDFVRAAAEATLPSESGELTEERVVRAAFDFADGTLLLTEAGSKKRASLHLVRGAAIEEEVETVGLLTLSRRFGATHIFIHIGGPSVVFIREYHPTAHI